MTTPNPILATIQTLIPGALIELFVLDASSIAGGGLSYFHMGTNELRQPVVWQGQTYQPFPIRAEGFDAKAGGQIARPTVTVSNINGAIGALVLSLNDLIGATLTRKRTFAKYLDAVNFLDGVNPTADPTAAFNDDVFTVLRKAYHDNERITWELGSVLDLEGEMLPGRQINATVCGWQYRSSECSYSGGAVAQIDDTATSNINLDDCSRSMVGCRLRFPKPASLPFGSFPACGAIQ